MRPLKILFFFFVFVPSSANLLAQSKEDIKSQDLLQEFRQQTEKWMNAYNSKDARNLAPLYAEDARYISGHVPGLEAIGKEKLLANFQNGMSGGGHVDSIEILSINVSCDLVTLLTKYQATNNGQTVSGRNLLVLKKVNRNWLIIIHMTVV